MKTTSYEISEKLFKLGFEGDAVYYYEIGDPENLWHITELQLEGIDNHYSSYDLETILEALPEWIDGDQELTVSKNYAGYFEAESIICSGIDAVCGKLENESLADCAARLLILLHEEGIVKFNN